MNKHFYTWDDREWRSNSWGEREKPDIVPGRTQADMKGNLKQTTTVSLVEQSSNFENAVRARNCGPVS